MSDVTRREALQKLAKGSVVVVATGAVSAVTLSATPSEKEIKAPPKQAVGMLYDATKCIGCQSCVAACTEANGLQPDTRLDGIHQAPTDLNTNTKNIIKLYKPAKGKYSYVKQQCMHCVDPACVAGCSFQALHKDPKLGVVSWSGELCTGCRYCQISCPYHIPRFQWEGFDPKVVKCELCQPRLAKGLEPACTSVCPARAVIFGTRDELLEEAHRRINNNPGKYYQDKVYGEHDGGGTQVLYLAAVPFPNLGLPDLGTESVPEKYLKWQHRVYQYLAVPAVMYASMVGVMRGNFKKHAEHLKEEEEKTGLRAQL
jgi:Fe-S-cluster-containing dehydrogenase component